MNVCRQNLLAVFLFCGFALPALTAQANQNLKFLEACSTDDNIEIVGVGDILLHSPLQIQATRSPMRYKSLWAPMLPFIKKADLAYANLEGPAAQGVGAGGRISTVDIGHRFDNSIYTSYPQFNYHPLLITDIKDSGFDIVSTANNHSLDRRALGVDRTIEALRRNGLPFSGTRTTVEAQDPDFQWHTLTKAKGRTIAWLACTFSTNGIPDSRNQVLPCFQNTKTLLNIVTRLAGDPDIHAVIVTPHWGSEYKLKPNAKETQLGRELLEAGATAVIGTHPHVVQPWEKYITRDGRETFIVYSTGNFVSGQPVVARETAVMVQLTLTGAPQAKLKIRGVSYLPIYMKRGGGHVITPILNMSAAPAESQRIWANAFGTEQRIQSLEENQPEKICNNSRK